MPTTNQLVATIAAVLEAKPREKTGTELLAAIGVRHEPHPEYGCRMVYAGAACLGPMHVGQAYALLCGAEYAA